MRTTRREFLSVAAATIALPAPFTTSAFAQSSSPIRIGAVLPLSGTLQTYGENSKIGLDIAMGYLNSSGGVSGRQIEISYYDDAGDPTKTVAGFRQLVSGGCKVIIPSAITQNILSISPLLDSSDAIMIAASAGISLTHEDFVRGMFRMYPNNYMLLSASAEYTAKTYPNVTKWAAIAADTASIRSIVQMFSSFLREQHRKLYGKEIQFVAPVFTKPGAGDYRNQIASLPGNGATGLINGLLGADAITLYKQMRQMGVLDQFDLFMDGTGVELLAAYALKQQTPKSIVVPLAWAPEAQKDNPVSNAFVQTYQRQRGMNERPVHPAPMSFDIVLAVADAVKRIGDQPLNMNTLIAALEQGKPEGIAGPIVFRKEDHQLMRSVFVTDFGADSSSETGWRVKKVQTFAPEGIVEPPSPGKKLELPT